MECLDLAWEGGVDVDGDRRRVQSENGIVRRSGHTSHQGYQISEGQDQLLPDLLGHSEKFGSFQKVCQSHGSAVEEPESCHQCWSIFFAKLNWEQSGLAEGHYNLMNQGGGGVPREG